MGFKKFAKKTYSKAKASYKEEALRKAEVRRKLKEEEHKAKLKYASLKAEAKEKHRYETYKQRLKQGGGGLGGLGIGFDPSGNYGKDMKKPISSAVPAKPKKRKRTKARKTTSKKQPTIIRIG